MTNRTTKCCFNVVRAIGLGVLSLASCCMLSGCLVAGYGTNTGGFILPGGFGLVLMLGLILWLLLRRR